MFIPANTSTGTISHPRPNSADILAPLFVPLEVVSLDPPPVEEPPLPAPADPLEPPPDPEVPDELPPPDPEPPGELPPLDPEPPDELPPLELPELPPELAELPPLDPPELPPELPPLEPLPAGEAVTTCARSRAQSTASAPNDENLMISNCLW